MKYILLFLSFLLCINCKQEKQPSANEIIDNAIANACGINCESVEISFNFRGKTYKSIKKGSSFQYERITNDSLGITRDVLTNNGFNRYLNDSLQILNDSIAQLYTNSVNSVHYFAQLPYGLNAPAAIKKWVGDTVIKNTAYHKISVRFKQEGGGVDFEDEFMYWIDKETFAVDFLAYSYQVEGGGIRFREAFNPRVINGVRFVDYKNYKTDDLKTPLEQLDKLFIEQKLKLLSKIEITEIEVGLLNN